MRKFLCVVERGSFNHHAHLLLDLSTGLITDFVQSRRTREAAVEGVTNNIDD